MKTRWKRFPVKPKTSPGKAAVCEGILLDTVPIKSRTQTYNPHTHRWIKRDDKTGRFCGVKKNGEPWHRVLVNGNTQVIALDW